ncbi:hypothetical protein ACWEWX_31265 [Streptomyces asiaticus]
MADIINAVALLIVVAGVVLYKSVSKVTARRFLEVMTVAAAVRITVAVIESDWVQIVLDWLLLSLFAVAWINEARKAAAGSTK